MAPRRIGVGVALALRAVLRQEPLAVGVGGKVGAVNGNVLAHVGQPLAYGGEDAIQAGRERSECSRSVLAKR